MSDADLMKLSRPELNDLASGDGVENPAGLPNKRAVVDAILEARANDGRQTGEPPAGERREIVRTNGQGAWWCPFCDRSHESKQRACDGCGAVRDGGEAVRS